MMNVLPSGSQHSEQGVPAETRTTRRNLTLSAVDGGCFGGMVGCGETYLPAFALAIGLTEMDAALAASVPVLCGGAVQLISPWGTRLLGSLQPWIVVCAALQALSFLPLVLVANRGSTGLTILLVIASIYWGAGMATGPAWNTWMEEIVPRPLRTRYFPRRTGIQLFSLLVTLVLAGIFLQVAESRGQLMFAFAVIFGMAMSLRLLSALALAFHTTPYCRPERPASTTQAFNVDLSKPYRLIIFLVLVQAAVQLSGPFFAPYMLKQLQFSYGQSMLLISLAFIAKIIALRYLGRIAKRIGSYRLLIAGSIGLVPLSALWIISPSIYWLVWVQILAGVTWAAYELGFFLMFFDVIPANQRTRLLAIYNFANSAALVLGATIGSLMLSVRGCTSETYYWLFGLSSLGRLACIPILLSFRTNESETLVSMTLRALSLRPSAGSIDVPVLPSIQRDDRAL